MSWLAAINLIGALNWYLLLTFLVGTALRVRSYRAIVGMVYRSSERWPKLRALVGTHRAIFLRWPTVLPAALALALTLVNMIASRFVWVDAQTTPGDLWRHPVGLIAVVLAGTLMGFLDFRAVFLGGRFDRAAVEAELDKAEHWLGTWKAPAIRFMTAGLINPRKIVGEQVRQALVKASLDANGQLWQMSVQIAARFAFGLALWITWAFTLR